ncbi:type III-B CRISPR module-associated Cmr3 family protein [Halonatronum saccharophilum]|uniref:type III-B CRISPR module-associated Cmr3 family protein n=1 Tax=Halonatronum saccharophilum TaxID=150060 RepID=UPI0004870340|nr:type III-B CRISPR module-associated Cmr3 family protein [Halonatronum saccharophilum]
MEKKKYLVRLKPLGNFFFGGKETFGEGVERSYLVESRVFPQQTTLLGTIRKEILMIKGIYKENWADYNYNDREKMRKVIGKGSFNINKFEQNFGMIESLSPVFLAKGEEFYFKLPFDYDLEFEKEEEGKSCLSNKRDFIPFFKGYNSKDGLPNKFISLNILNNQLIKSFDEIFKKDEQIGITKVRNNDDEGYYKQIFYRLKSDFEFAFLLQTKKELIKDEYSNIVYMGADSSAFKIEIREYDKDFEELFSNKADDNRVVLVSDTYLNEEAYTALYEKADFVLGQPVYFKNMIRQNKNYKKIENQYVFLEKASVIYGKDKETCQAIIKEIESKNLNQIGYNITNYFGEDDSNGN